MTENAVSLVNTETGEYIAADEFVDVVEEGAAALQRIITHSKMLRDDWVKVGKALAVGRAKHPINNNKYGEWCLEHGLDMDARLRSDALWVSENIEEIRGGVFDLIEDPLTENHPTNIRIAVRKQKKKAELEAAKEAYIAKDEGIVGPVVRHQDAMEFINSFEMGSVDLLFTDPPYSTDVPDIHAFAEWWVPTALSKIKATGRAFICIGAYPEELHAYLSVLLELDGFIVDAPLIWTYRNTLGQTPKHKYNLNYQCILHVYTALSNSLDNTITNEMFSVQDINAPDGRQGDRLHTWQKPDELAERLIRHATREGDLVIDPFTCTGTFLLAASRLGRTGVGSDINLDNLKIGVERGCRLEK